MRRTVWNHAPTIGDLRLKNAVFLAPMAGITDAPFRRLAHRFGAGLVISEMVASNELITGGEEAHLRAESAGVAPHAVQLAGREATALAESARRLEAAGADLLDINMGCPSKRVTTGYAGSALMRDLEHATRLIEAVVGAVKVPVTVKMRLGWDDENLNAPELARRAEKAGVALVTVHGRTRCQFYKGRADWKAIAAVKQAVSIPVIANGDCESFEDAAEMLSQSGADGIMIGRGAYGRPWFPGAVARYLSTGVAPAEPANDEIAVIVAEHYEGILDHYGVDLGLRAARKHLAWYMDASPRSDADAKALRRDILTAENPDSVRALLTCWFDAAERRDAA
ncbi:tRNA dihydrouridine synthase DusB [Rhodobium gokarnense]|uniref:tRNA-dihydrouridine synthase n=1 Tax=Rhodobium gokarnense TaxID=364296 RepID=A0ABT3HB14_9HYPH|nr:tRNA dihydrouridine synthase DusB [Rhodobium gokarnense]MCW2307587.1 nifR3 family TIM-barrel protein [Rhodobium gokarnense]